MLASVHGSSIGALAVFGRPELRADFEPLLRAMPFIPAPDAYASSGQADGAGDLVMLGPPRSPMRPGEGRDKADSRSRGLKSVSRL